MAARKRVSKTQDETEKNLRLLAAKAHARRPFHAVREQISTLWRAGLLMVLAAVYSNVSQLNLTPVYGSIPSAMWHSQGVTVACFLGWSANSRLRSILPRNGAAILPLFALYIPSIQWYLFRLSGLMGATWGPAITEALTLMPLVMLSASCVASVLEELNLSILPKYVAEAAPGVGAYMFYKMSEYCSGIITRRTIGVTLLQTRLGLQVVLGALYAIISPSRLLLFALPAIQHTLFFNTHASFADQTLNATLAKSGWSLLARHESVTGYISVLESLNDGFRVMRCDHSLLGGEWLHVPQYSSAVQMQLKEPIYAIFAMLEAVRLVQVPMPVHDSGAHALVIGLGVGTTPGALVTHGINTTVVEIDPIVHDYAMKYFSLPHNHTPIIENAVTYMDHLAGSTQPKYDYIVHDVFTGGAEPVDLFTLEFLENLRSVLKADGVIAINYAGDLLLPSARLIVRTIQFVFPSCRIYRETEPPSAALLASQGQDFTNMVIFCVKRDAPIIFRRPNEADYLGSGARKAYLMPSNEIVADVFAEREGDGGVLRKNDTQRLSKWQQKSAVGHWNVMRTVLPDEIWQAW
ncbi:MAG: hypothetical protein M1818_005642 [Claussenomyces sp. TS43310]|nr:MAG: hypothetical protein M1818_005642 [Claussenomyces sp. TS43310]